MSAPLVPAKHLTADDLTARLDHLEVHVSVMLEELEGSHSAFLVAMMLSRMKALTARIRTQLPN